MIGMTLYGYDAAYQPDLTKVKAAGGIAVNGYLTGKYAWTTTQPAAALAAGLGWWATYEEDPAELVHASRATGRAVGNKILNAYRAKRDHHGRPLPLDGTAAVYPSVDVEVARGDAAACDDAWEGLGDVLHDLLSPRYYGEGAIGDHLYRVGLVDGPWWLAAPTSWPGYDVTLPDICAVQLVGTNVPGTDRNHLITNPSALGAIWPDGSPYAQGELVMDAEAKAAIADLKAHVDSVKKLITEVFHLEWSDGTSTTGTVQGAVRYELARDNAADAQRIAQVVTAAVEKAQGTPGGNVQAEVTAALEAFYGKALGAAAGTSQ